MEETQLNEKHESQHLADEKELWMRTEMKTDLDLGESGARRL